VAVSADGAGWFLIGASPDIRAQVESFPPLLPGAGVRGTGIAGVLLANADLDHVLGLWALREGEPLRLFATPAVREALTDDLRLASTLAEYCGLSWQEPPCEPAPLCYHDGRPSGLSYAAAPVAGQPPRYRGHTYGDGLCIGYRLADERCGRRLCVFPTVAALDTALLTRLRDCDALLFDGTFWSDDELRVAGVSGSRATDMGHLPVGGPGGSLVQLASLAVPRKVYIHVNNTNPILIESAPERRAVEAAGVEVGWDGYEFRL
jgi:pyrroloquinoline quinone biosynthesis protein B